MKKSFGIRLAAIVLALAVSTSASAAVDRENPFDPIKRIIKRVERVLRGFADTLILPKP